MTSSMCEQLDQFQYFYPLLFSLIFISESDSYYWSIWLKEDSKTKWNFFILRCLNLMSSMHILFICIRILFLGITSELSLSSCILTRPICSATFLSILSPNCSGLLLSVSSLCFSASASITPFSSQIIVSTSIASTSTLSTVLCFTSNQISSFFSETITTLLTFQVFPLSSLLLFLVESFLLVFP